MSNCFTILKLMYTLRWSLSWRCIERLLKFYSPFSRKLPLIIQMGKRVATSLHQCVASNSGIRQSLSISPTLKICWTPKSHQIDILEHNFWRNVRSPVYYVTGNWFGNFFFETFSNQEETLELRNRRVFTEIQQPKKRLPVFEHI